MDLTISISCEEDEEGVQTSIDPPIQVKVDLASMNITDPLEFRFPNKDTNNTNNTGCVFWDDTNNTWSSDGCLTLVDYVENGTTTCKCEHLTMFNT